MLQEGLRQAAFAAALAFECAEDVDDWKAMLWRLSGTRQRLSPTTSFTSLYFSGAPHTHCYFHAELLLSAFGDLIACRLHVAIAIRRHRRATLLSLLISRRDIAISNKLHA